MNPQGQPNQDTNGFVSPGVEENGGEMQDNETDEADERDEQDEPNEPDEPDEPDELDEPDEPDESDESDESDELDEPDEPDDLDEPDEPDESSDYSSDDSEEEPEEQEQEAQPVLVNIRRPRPWNRRRVAQRTTFTVMQMQELERLFHRYPFPDMLMRQDIARRMNVTEARVQIWFKNRRRRQRAFMWRNVRHMVQGNPIHINVGAQQNIILPPQPALMFLPHAWMWYPQPAWIRYPQPQALGLLLPPVAPYPPLFVPAPPQPQPLFFPPLPHVPHGGPHPHVWAWFVSVFYP
ncbi:unnamed protein product [Pipistrellus nathusii]|uniref:Homeobox domain-containing protein n=1 Tax=Pipistrellus nathusii TaxID=59473 RepID=A0ABP0AID8_PIPNA